MLASSCSTCSARDASRAVRSRSLTTAGSVATAIEERGNPEQRGAVPRHELACAVGHAVDLCPNRTADSEPLHVGGQFVNRRVSTVRLLAEGAQHDRIEVARQLARERTAADAARRRNEMAR